MKDIKEMEEAIEDFGDSLSKINVLSDKIEKAGDSILDTEEKIKDMLSIKDTVNQLHKDTKNALDNHQKALKEFETNSSKSDEALSNELKATQEKLDNLIYQINTMTGKFEEKLNSILQATSTNKDAIQKLVVDTQKDTHKKIEETQSDLNAMMNAINQAFKTNRILLISNLVIIIVILVMVLLLGL